MGRHTIGIPATTIDAKGPFLTQAEERAEKAKHRKDRAAKFVPRQGPKTNVRPAGPHVNHKNELIAKALEREIEDAEGND